MDPIAVIERATAESSDLTLLPPPRDDAVEALEAELRVPLPSHLRLLLKRAGGIDGTRLGTIDFTCRSFDVELGDIFPSGLPIADDGSGNHWVLDLTPDAAVAPVFYAAHDPPVVLLESPDLGHFLTEVVAKTDRSRTSLIDEVRDDRPFRVWRTNPSAVDRATALEQGDDEVRAFAAELDERFAIIDLRRPEIGMGFAWGRYGPPPTFAVTAIACSSRTPNRNGDRVFCTDRSGREPALRT